MSVSKLCPICQSALAASAPEGLCPKCLWASLLGPEIETEGMENPRRSPFFSLPAPAGDSLGIFGEYELLSEIARGGMGVVYRARQISLQRVVALKMILTARLPGEADMKRFRAEAEAVASLEHPNIVPIHEIGEEDGTPYYTMKFIPGGSLADRLARARERDQTWTSAATQREQDSRDDCFDFKNSTALMAKIARAVHYAHQRGILHRDLKPSNILMDERGEPLVTDFGLAKQIETDSQLTLSGAVLGTPAYIAPEQAAGGKSLTTAADVYSLGTIFYELLTGCPPFQGDTPLHTLRRVVDEEPPRPTSINPNIERNLEAICLKCLQKNPSQRYGSTEAMAEDLERWLRDEPVQARSSTWAERMLKWGRRHPARAALIGVGMLAPTVIIAVLLSGHSNVLFERNNALEQERKAKTAALHAERAAEEAVAAKARTRQNLYAADMLLAQHALDDGNLNLARSLVESYRPQGSDPAGSPDLRGFEWRHLWQRCQGDKRETLYGHSNPVYSVTFSPDNKLLASGDAQGKVKLWDLASRSTMATLKASDKAIVRVTFSPDGQALATADALGRTKVWSLRTRAVVWKHEGRNPGGVHFSARSYMIGVTGGDVGMATNSVALVFDWTTGKELFRVEHGDFESFSPDGKFAFITRRKDIGTEIWELSSGRVIYSVPGYNGELTVSPGGNFFAMVWPGDGILLAPISDAKPLSWLRSSLPFERGLGFSPDSSVMATAGADQVVRLWNVAEGREVNRLLGHVDKVTSVAFSPDGKLLASSSSDHTVLLWPTEKKKEATVISDTIPPYRISSNGVKLAGRLGNDVTKRHEIHVWDLVTMGSVVLDRSNNPLKPDFFSADSQTLFARDTVKPNGQLPLFRWDLNAPSNSPKITLLQVKHTNEVLGSAAMPGSAVYAVGQERTGIISLWDPVTGRALGELRSFTNLYIGIPFRFSPDGKKLASYALWSEIRLLDCSQPQEMLSVLLPSTSINESAFSPDGKILAVASDDHCIHIIETATMEKVGTLRGHQRAIATVAFSPDGRTLASCGADRGVKLWSWPARREAATLDGGSAPFCFLSFSPDGNTLVAGGWGETRIFRVPSLAQIDRGL